MVIIICVEIKSIDSSTFWSSAFEFTVYVKNSRKWIQPEYFLNSNTFFKFVKQSILEWATVLQMKKYLRKFVVPGTVFFVLVCTVVMAKRV